MLSFLRLLFAVLVLSGGFSSCQKEFSFEADNSTAVFKVDCSTPIISGTYIQSTTLTLANTVQVIANVTNPGSYSLVTTANGITFTASGNFSDTGVNQIITFIGAGTPVTATNTVFAMPGGCAFTIPVNAPVPQASFVLNCNSGTVNGDFYLNFVLDPAENKATVTATVTVPGAYHLTQTLNGITFTASGTFAATGSALPVTFTASGISTVLGQNNFTTGTNNCPFTVNVTALNINADFLVANIGTVTKLFNTNLTGILNNVTGGPSLLSIDGFRSTTGTEKFSIDFLDTGGTIVTGSYNNLVPAYGNPSAIATYIDATGAPWESISGTFIITAITALSAKGNFTGVLTKLNTGGAPITLPFTTGSFRISF
jgi:hypothetical protein